MKDAEPRAQAQKVALLVTQDGVGRDWMVSSGWLKSYRDRIETQRLNGPSWPPWVRFLLFNIRFMLQVN